MEDLIHDDPPSANETGRLSQLNEDVIGRIIFFLPAKDAACMSIFSKTWRHVWDSLPVFSFSSYSLSRKLNLRKRARSFVTDAEEYMDLIDKSLENLRHCKVRIDRFELELFESRESHASRFNQFIELANKNLVEELVLHSQVYDPRQKKPSVPLATFASTNSFILLDLRACVLRPELFKDKPKFPRLRKLRLYKVKLLRDNMVENLLANCPLLQEFSLVRCNVDRVELRGHPMLKKVRIVGVGVIRVEDININNFYCEYAGDYKCLELHLVNCYDNLKELSLFSNFTVEHIEELVCKLTHLETLRLRPCILLERLKISSPQLQYLELHTGREVGVKEVEIDAPNLQYYRYHYFGTTRDAPTSPILINTARLQVAEILVCLETYNLLQWFINFKYTLESFEYNALEIHVDCDMRNKDSIIEDLRLVSDAPPVYLESLTVICYWRSSFDFSAFFDCCFWICRPKTIVIKSSCGSNSDFIDLLRDKLIPWEENPHCCENSPRKCWRHYLEDVKIQRNSTMKENQRTLHLEWKMSSQKRKTRWE